MNKVQKAFHYFLDLLNDVYEPGWKTSEAVADAAIEFGLDKKEIQQFKEMLGIPANAGSK
ncbi:MAG: hypothetical protein RIR57_86 [Bacteroidota bacterium]|jgi:PP-loop superfamily ATP-utilizing enzyme